MTTPTKALGLDQYDIGKIQDILNMLNDSNGSFIGSFTTYGHKVIIRYSPGRQEHIANKIERISE